MNKDIHKAASENHPLENIDGETWKPINGFEGYYEASNLGKIRSLSRIVKHKNRGHKQFKRGKQIKFFLNHKGYPQVDLRNQHKRLSTSVHRIIAKTFIENHGNKPQVNHKNGIKTDNRSVNLEWCTPGENVRHAYRMGLSSSPMKGKFGADHNRSRPVVMMTKKRDEIQRFDSLTMANKITGVNTGNIQSACCGRANTAGGYLWEYL